MSRGGRAAELGGGCRRGAAARRARVVLVLAVLAAIPLGAHAQTRTTPQRPAAPAQRGIGIRGFGDVGAVSFTAEESFKAILGSRSGIVFGGGVEVVMRPGVFVGLRASRFRKDGERVFLFEGEQFDLGIDTRVTITPVELTGGYRFGDRQGARVIPYAGGGIGWHRYEETSDFATDAENVNETHTGYHLLGGAEVRLARWIGVAGEAQWTTVGDALGQDPNGVSAAFDETNLGGTTFRVKVLIGR